MTQADQLIVHNQLRSVISLFQSNLTGLLKLVIKNQMSAQPRKIFMAYSILIPQELNNELTALSKLEERPKSYLVRKAIQIYLQELKQDKED